MQRPITTVFAAMQLALRALTLLAAGFLVLVPWTPPLALSRDLTSLSAWRDRRAAVSEVVRLQVHAAYARLPLSFELNHGQTDARVKLLARGSGYMLFLTPNEAVLAFRQREHLPTRPALLTKQKRSRGTVVKATPTVVQMRFADANAEPAVTGWDRLPGTVNYFIGNDPAQWRTNIPTYGKVIYKNVYRGIDLVFSGSQGQLEYDLIVHPGANPSSISIEFRGTDGLEVDAQGDLVLYTAAGVIRQRKPVVYQEIDGVRRGISGGYVLTGSHRLGFQVATYEASRPLIIDPVLEYSTYLGGGIDFGGGIAVDLAGDAYVTGRTASATFPTTPGAFQPTRRGPPDDAFVTKLNSAGTALVYSTYLGGSSDEEAHGIAVDIFGNAYVTGITFSTNFPTTLGAFQPTPPGRFSHAFVTKLNPKGTDLAYSTYLGGSRNNGGSGIAVDIFGNAYVTGTTDSIDFPTTLGAFQPTNPTPGSVPHAFVTKLNPDLTGTASLVYSTYLGGSGNDGGGGIAVDTFGNPYVTGATSSTNFPTTLGAFQSTNPTPGSVLSHAFVTKLNPDITGTASLVYSTYLGGSGNDGGGGIAVDTFGNPYVTGTTNSIDFPTTLGAFQPTNPTPGGVLSHAFVTKLTPDITGTASLVYSTYLGGSGNDVGIGIAVDTFGNAYVTGTTNSIDFPTTPKTFRPSPPGTVFVAKIVDVPQK